MTVRPLRPSDRPNLVSMLLRADDAPVDVARSYQRAKPPHVDFVAWSGDVIEGMITGTIGANYRGNSAFDSLELQSTAHALLMRICVSRAARLQAVGLGLFEAFAVEALARRCR